MAPHTEVLWLAIGFTGQLLFTGRFVVQWLASEKQRASVVPLAFWYLSIAGGLTLLCYAIYKRDAVFIAGQSMGVLIYVRNLVLLRSAARRAREDVPHPPRPLANPPRANR